eukprot:RCo005795
MFRRCLALAARNNKHPLKYPDRVVYSLTGQFPGSHRLRRRWQNETDVLRDSPVLEHNDVRWYVIDATDRTVENIANHASYIVQGMLRPDYRSDRIMGDNLIILNAYNVILTHEKWTRKPFMWHTRRIQGFHVTSMAEMRFLKGPEFPIFQGIWDILPKSPGSYRRCFIEKVYIFRGVDHPFKSKILVPYEVPHWEYEYHRSRRDTQRRPKLLGIPNIEAPLPNL